SQRARTAPPHPPAVLTGGISNWSREKANLIFGSLCPCPNLSAIPITAGPQATLSFQRTGPSKRTANPLRVVLPQWTLIAAVQAGSLAPCANRRVALPSEVTTTGRFSARGRFRW